MFYRSNKIKIFYPEMMPRLWDIMIKERSKGKRVVMINGCFDILSSGHVELLEKAKSLGDILVVSLSRDKVIKHFKGDSRPFNDEWERAKVMAGLGCVDYVTFNDEEIPLAGSDVDYTGSFSFVGPDIFVLNADNKYIAENRAFVEERGALLVLLPRSSEISTTGTLEKMNHGKSKGDDNRKKQSK